MRGTVQEVEFLGKIDGWKIPGMDPGLFSGGMLVSGQLRLNMGFVNKLRHTVVYIMYHFLYFRDLKIDVLNCSM